MWLRGKMKEIHPLPGGETRRGRKDAEEGEPGVHGWRREKDVAKKTGSVVKLNTESLGE
jgi:hypothetical protein